MAALDCLPRIPDGARVLDVGCGAGEALSKLGVAPSRGAGVDLDSDAISRGKATGYDLRVGPAERLPFGEEAFDVVMCRVALPYMRVLPALAEMRRVLRAGGDLWLLLHGYPSLRRRAWGSIRRLSLVDLVFCGYVALNSLALRVFHRQFSFFGRRMETVQTAGGIRSLLERVGFGEIRVQQDKYFQVWARRPG